MWIFIVFPMIIIPTFIKMGLYRAVLQHIGINTIVAIIKSISLSILSIGFLMMMVRELSFPRSTFIIFWFIAIIITLGSRFWHTGFYI